MTCWYAYDLIFSLHQLLKYIYCFNWYDLLSRWIWAIIKYAQGKEYRLALYDIVYWIVMVDNNMEAIKLTVI